MEKKIYAAMIGLFCFIMLFIAMDSYCVSVDDGVVSTYKCDYKIMSLNTDIEITDDSNERFSISGNVFAWLEDPLQMKDAKGNILAYAGDSYNLISQNDHGIYVGNEHICDVIGNINFFGDNYTIKDKNGEDIAIVKFNALDTVGHMYDKNDTLIAQYNSGAFNKDYTIYVYKDNFIDEKALLMIFASYVSDKEADNND